MDSKARAQQAKHLLEDEVLQMAVDGVLSYHKSILTSRSATDEEVLQARQEFLALESVMARLRSFVSDGRITEKREQDRASD